MEKVSGAQDPASDGLHFGQWSELDIKTYIWLRFHNTLCHPTHGEEQWQTLCQGKLALAFSTNDVVLTLCSQS